MTKGDAVVEKGASKLQRLANQAARTGRLRSRLAQPLAEDAAFLRKLKPSLMVTRAKGEGPNPFLVLGIALAAGIALAKIVDWRGHAHPRD
ncbi:MAG: hypothetical protein WD027_03680, partial [Gaiellales bacterium]